MQRSLSCLAPIFIVGWLTSISASNALANESECSAVAASVVGADNWGRPSLQQALATALEHEVEVRMIEHGPSLRALPSPTQLATWGHRAGARWVLIVTLSRRGWKYTARARLLDIATKEYRMDFRSDYFKPDEEPPDRGVRIARKTLERLDQLCEAEVALARTSEAEAVPVPDASSTEKAPMESLSATTAVVKTELETAVRTPSPQPLESRKEVRQEPSSTGESRPAAPRVSAKFSALSRYINASGLVHDGPVAQTALSTRLAFGFSVFGWHSMGLDGTGLSSDKGDALEYGVAWAGQLGPTSLRAFMQIEDGYPVGKLDAADSVSWLGDVSLPLDFHDAGQLSPFIRAFYAIPMFGTEGGVSNLRMAGAGVSYVVNLTQSVKLEHEMMAYFNLRRAAVIGRLGGAFSWRVGRHLSVTPARILAMTPLTFTAHREQRIGPTATFGASVDLSF